MWLYALTNGSRGTFVLSQPQCHARDNKGRDALQHLFGPDGQSCPSSTAQKAVFLALRDRGATFAIDNEGNTAFTAALANGNGGGLEVQNWIARTFEVQRRFICGHMHMHLLPPSCERINLPPSYAGFV